MFKFVWFLWSTSSLLVGFLQLAGGTNAHTVHGLKKVGLFQTSMSSTCSSLFLSYYILHFPPALRDFCSSDHLVYSDGSSQALIGGVAYGGYARKVLFAFFNPKLLQLWLSHLHILYYVVPLSTNIKFWIFLFQIVGRVLSRIGRNHGGVHIEDYAHHFVEAVAEALALVGTVKSSLMDPSLVTSQ